MRSVYGSLPAIPEKLKSRASEGVLDISHERPIDILLAKEKQPLNDGAETTPRCARRALVTDQRDGNHEQAHVRSPTYPPDRSHESDLSKEVNQTLKEPLDSYARPHRNMYDFDTDDLSTLERPSSPGQISDAEGDDAELRKASVTNPWTIAKLNAVVSSKTSPPSKAASEDSNQQLRTPDPDLGITHLLSRSHRRSFGQGFNLPSPARSDLSHSPPMHQNPGPPLQRRRLACRSEEEDDIEFTQQSADAASTQGQPTSLQLWVNMEAAQSTSPSLRVSNMLDEHGCVERRKEEWQNDSNEKRNAMHPTQLTYPAADELRTLQLPTPTRKPFVSPLRAPRGPIGLDHPPRLTASSSPGSEHPSLGRQVLGGSGRSRKSESPNSRVYPPTLPQSHQHPMASPPRLQPSPGQIYRSSRQLTHLAPPELDDIMDFEHRKKAVKSRYLNPGQAAKIQRESTGSLLASERRLRSSGPFRRSPPPGLNIRDETDHSCDPISPVSQRDPDAHPPLNHERADISSQKRSPHLNRYQAAKAALIRLEPANPSLHTPTSQDINLTEVESLSHLPEDDPRAYLIRHREASFPIGHTDGRGPDNTVPEMISPALKIKRTKTFKLPFETIPRDLATYNIAAKPTTSFPPLPKLTAQINELGKVDTYHQSGSNGFMVWDANSLDLDAWEEKVMGLVREKYVGRLGVSEEVPANLQVRLSAAFRAHCERHL